MAAEPRAAAADLAACRAALAQGSRTFLAASHLLPARVRDPACALYAFCRMADDAVDAGDDPGAAVEDLRQRIHRAHEGRPADHLEDRALAAVMARHRIPVEWPLALVEGFAWDAAGRRYETLDEVLDYAARVAGTVGAMMAQLMGAGSPAALARACELGVAMQLSNIARDVGEDAAMGRLYLPRQWLHEAGIDATAWLRDPVFRPGIAAATQRLLRVADALYDGAGAGVAALPADCRAGINAARFLYREIGEQVRRQGLDGVSRRAVVSPARKLHAVGRAAWDLLRSAPAAGWACAPPLPAVAFLVAATPVGARAGATPSTLHWWQWRRQFERTIDLFDQLGRRDRERHRLPRSSTA